MSTDLLTPEEVGYLRQMEAKLADPACPVFTADEVAHWASIAQGEEIAASDPYIVVYCLPTINNHRDDLCLYK